MSHPILRKINQEQLEFLVSNARGGTWRGHEFDSEVGSRKYGQDWNPGVPTGETYETVNPEGFQFQVTYRVDNTVVMRGLNTRDEEARVVTENSVYIVCGKRSDAEFSATDVGKRYNGKSLQVYVFLDSL